jgi:hypothetical protein
MNNIRVWKFCGLACLLIIFFTLLVGMGRHNSFNSAARNGGDVECSDSIKDCKLPVRFIGDKDGCACFACEHGKNTQHLVCTKNDSDKKILFQKVRDSGSR